MTRPIDLRGHDPHLRERERSLHAARQIRPYPRDRHRRRRATVWIGTLVAASTQMPLGWLAIVPVVLVVTILWRVIADRLSNREDDHYDRIEK